MYGFGGWVSVDGRPAGVSHCFPITRVSANPYVEGIKGFEQAYERALVDVQLSAPTYFRELIETHAVDVIGPDPADIGGIAELKWVAEYADLHGILMAPHGVFDGIIGLAAHVQVAATLPPNFIGFEYPVARPDWWYDIMEGLPNPIVKDSLIDVWDTPGLGVTFNIDKAVGHLNDEDKDFFD